MSDIKKCPFCGGEVALRKSKCADLKAPWYVSCRTCGIATFMRETPEEAAGAWNRRPNDE